MDDNGDDEEKNYFLQVAVSLWIIGARFVIGLQRDVWLKERTKEKLPEIHAKKLLSFCGQWSR